MRLCIASVFLIRKKVEIKISMHRRERERWRTSVRDDGIFMYQNRIPQYKLINLSIYTHVDIS